MTSTLGSVHYLYGSSTDSHGLKPLVTFITSALVLSLVSRALYLHRQVSHAELIRRDTSGALSYEVRRRVYMAALPSHVSDFPEPREVRIKVLRLTGVVLWRKAISIALPPEACTHLEDISAKEYDGSFPAWLRMGASLVK